MRNLLYHYRLYFSEDNVYEKSESEGKMVNKIKSKKNQVIKKELIEIMMSDGELGYGEWNNVSKYSFLHKGLSEKNRIEYEKELEKKDPIKYHEYKLWEKAFEEINNLKE